MKPMLATAGPIPRGPQWAYEVKWDGMRVLAEVDTDRLRLTSRNGTDITEGFPELRALAGLGRPATFDGEVVAFDADGLPSFDRLVERIPVRRRRKADALAAGNPVSYVIFDLLMLDGVPLVGLPFRERRDLLTGLVLPVGPFIVPEVFDDADALLEATRERGLEGVVAKRWDAPYRPGVRSRSWVKHSHRSTTDAVVVAWRPAAGGSVASLAVAVPGPDGALHYRGTAGSGISQSMGRALAARLRAGEGMPAISEAGPDAERLDQSGFRWAVPDAVVEIAHLGLSGAGRFRQPVVARFRADLRAADIGAPGGPSQGRTVPAPTAADAATVVVDGRSVRLTHLDKVLYPADGTTKAQVIEYYATVAEHLLALAADRPVTRRRWPEGVDEPSFFEKNLPAWAPPWLRRVGLPTSREPITYPVLGRDDRAGLVWLAAHSALELHTPQWQVSREGAPSPPDRLVIDLDPGPGVGLAECARVASLVRPLLVRDGLVVHAVLSGSKGLHLYAQLPDLSRSSDEVAGYVRDLAQRLVQQFPGLLTATMAKQARVGRVFLDWSQNRAAKTTVAPWSLRGTRLPRVALPVDWDDIESGQLRQVVLGEALELLSAGRVPLPW